MVDCKDLSKYFSGALLGGFLAFILFYFVAITGMVNSTKIALLEETIDDTKKLKNRCYEDRRELKQVNKTFIEELKSCTKSRDYYKIKKIKCEASKGNNE